MEPTSNDDSEDRDTVLDKKAEENGHNAATTFHQSTMRIQGQSRNWNEESAVQPSASRCREKREDGRASPEAMDPLNITYDDTLVLCDAGGGTPV